MEGIEQLQKQYKESITSLFYQGLLNDHFLDLHKLQDESSPSFAAEVVLVFFDDSEERINNLVIALHQPIVDYNKVDLCINQFKGSSYSIGAEKVNNACVEFKSVCDQKYLEGCLICLEDIKHEYYLIKNKLETLIGLERHIVELGGRVPSIV